MNIVSNIYVTRLQMCTMWSPRAGWRLWQTGWTKQSFWVTEWNSKFKTFSTENLLTPLRFIASIARFPQLRA